MVLNPKYKHPEIQKVLAYIAEKYDTEPEFLWAKSPDCAVFRHWKNRKWFAALLIIPKKKLGLPNEGEIAIADLKCDPILLQNIVDAKSYFYGYHMNKQNWLTVLLDGSVADDKLFGLIDLSYDLTK